MAMELFNIIVFPGFLFLSVFGMAAEFIDRKLYARFQNRKGPPWFQPFADFIKLSSKEIIIPERADPKMFRLMPIIALTTVITASFYIPLWSTKALFSFDGDLVVVMYLLTITTLVTFLGGLYSTSIYSRVGAVRCVTQMLAYEVPFFLSFLGPAILAHTWTLSQMAEFYSNHPEYLLLNIPGLLISCIALLGKLEKVPFDIPEAETEIVAGPFTEYTGRLFAFFRLALDIEMVVGSAMIAAVVMPFGLHLPMAIGFPLFLLKVLSVIFVLSLLRSVFARLRIDQMVNFCWEYLAPSAFAYLLLCIVLKGLMS